MKQSVEMPQSRFNALKWTVVFCLLVAVTLGNYLYRDSAVVVRVVTAGVAMLIALMTQQGKAAAAFVQEAYTEIHRIVWPTRQEALQTTMVVAVVTVVIALALWGIDTILVRLVTFITGLRF